jgi:hypothetical protein
MPKTTVACAIKVGDPDTVQVFQYDDTFDSGTDATLPFWETNYNAKMEFPDYTSIPELEAYELKDGSGGI